MENHQIILAYKDLWSFAKFIEIVYVDNVSFDGCMFSIHYTC